MAISPQEFNYIRNLVHARAGVVLTERERYLVEARLLPLARRQQINSINEVIQRLQEESANGLPGQVVDALLPKETSFFRDLHPFNLLRSHIFPTLEMKRVNELRLRILCLGCASGQEPYSVAMVLHYYFSQLMKWEVEILGVDLSEEALAQAQEGRYNEIEANRGLTPMMLRQYLRPEGKQFLVLEDLTRVVRFEQWNLLQDWPDLPPMDLILFRNVMSYWTPDARRAVLQKAGRVLKPDGYLLLGARETTVNVDSSFTLVPVEKTVYFQRTAGA